MTMMDHTRTFLKHHWDAYGVLVYLEYEEEEALWWSDDRVSGLI